MHLQPEKIHDHLKTQWLGLKLHYQTQTDSTNRWAERGIQKGSGRGEVFIADYQTHGLGRKMRVWESTLGKNILVSFIDLPPKDASKVYQLTLVIGVAFLEGLLALYPDLPLKLKWPNDLFLGYKKLGGILCATQNNFVIMGVGLNVNSTIHDFSIDVKHIATSLLIHKGDKQCREEILASCLNAYEKWRSLYEEKGLKPIINEWNAYSILSNKHVKILDNSISYTGITEGLDDNGFLIVNSNHIKKTVVCGDVIMLRG